MITNGNKYRVLKLTITIVLGITVILAIIISYLSYKDRGVLDFTCNSILSFNSSAQKTSVTGSIVFQFDRNLRGVADISGNMVIDGKSHTLYRRTTFNYQHEEDNIYRIFNFKSTKYEEDNTIGNVLFFDSTTSGEYYISIRKFRNAWGLGNIYSPELMCVVKS